MNTARIYIVEDEALIAMEISDRLTQLGYEVCGKAARGEQALEEIPRTRPDVVLMDICLAGKLDGIETAAKLRQLLDLPVVFLSAFSDAKLVEGAIGSGAFGYLVKPIKERELQATIQAALYKHRLECTLQETNANLDEAVRKRTAELMQREAQLRDLFDGTSDLMQSVAPDGRLLFVNRAWRETLGYSPDEVATLNLFDVVHADCRDHYRSLMRRIIAGENVGLAEISFQAKDGRVVVAEGHVSLRVEGGRPVSTRGIFRDITERKAAEAEIHALNKNLEHLVTERTGKLRESEERYRYLMSTVPGAVYEFSVDAAGHRSMPFISERIVDLIGLSAADIMADVEIAFQQIPADAMPAMEQSIRHSVGNLSPWLHKFPIRATTGEEKWLRGHSVPHRHEDGTTYWTGVFVDVTAQKQAEEALRKSEERFRAAYHNASVGISICDLIGRLQEVNQALCEILGYSKQELLAKDFQSLTHPDDLSGNLDRIRQLLTGAATHHVFEKRYVRKDGDTVWAHVGLSVIRNLDGTPSHLLAMVQDITDRKRAEEALRESEARLIHALDATSDGIWDWDIRTGAVYYSPQWMRLLDYSPADVSPTADFFLTILHPDDRARTMQIMQDHMEGRTPTKEVENRLRVKSGEFRWFLDRGKVIEWDKDGAPLRMVGTITDITERKQTEAALQFLSSGIAHLHGEAFFSEMAVQVARLLDLEIGFVGKLLAAHPPRIRALGLSIDGQALPPVEYDLAGTPCEGVIGKHTVIFTENVQQLFPDDQMLADLGISSYAAVPLFDMNGRPIGHVGVMGRRPLRQVKQVEDLLRLFAVQAAAELERQRTETKFHDLFEFSPDAIIMVNQKGLITLANRQAESLFGYSLADLLNLPVEKLMPESWRQEHLNLRQQFLASATPRIMGSGRSGLRALKKDGTIFPIDISLSPIQSEDGLLVAAAVRDITERKQAEQALSESEERFRILFEQAAVGVAQVDTATGRFVRINQKYCDITGYSQAEMLALKVQQLTHPDDLEAGQNNMARLTAGEIPEFKMEKRYIRKDGAVVWVKLTVSPMWQPGAAPDYNIAVAQDITERKQAEVALQSFQDQIRQMQKMEAIGQLAGGVAHDFNNILTAILGNAEMANAKIGSDHPARLNLTRILEAGDRASRLVQQILAFTHQQEFSRTVLALPQIVNEVLALMRATLPAGIELTSTYDAATPNVLADATQIHQVLMNLCTNAWHALGNRLGSISVDLTPVTLAQPLHSLHAVLPPGFYARLSVRDTGCGMDPDTVERIFDPFFTTKPVGQGTGLGLSVVHGIVRGHQGAIAVESQPGQGTTFHLYFPTAETAALAGEPAGAKQIRIQGPSRHLLYLDDEEMLVELVRAQLEPLGYRITGCTKTAEALDAIRADPKGFDVVVTDYNMPGMSGLDVARAVSQIRADLPVVLVSGYLSPTAHAAALAAEIKEIVYKPTLLKQLGDVITRLLNKTQPT